MKKMLYLLCGILLLGCKNDSTTSPNPEMVSNPKPEFVLNQIQCSFKVYTNINNTTKDTVIVTQMSYGLDAYYHLNYGLISKQIISFNGYKDTLIGSAVDPKPDYHFAPAWSTQSTIPNILNDLDSVKIVVQIYGSFYGDSNFQNPISSFYCCDSNYASISRFSFVRP
jgi:hypothetical protein